MQVELRNANTLQVCHSGTAVFNRDINANIHCLIYNDQAELRRSVTPFLQAGLSLVARRMMAPTCAKFQEIQRIRLAQCTTCVVSVGISLGSNATKVAASLA